MEESRPHILQMLRWSDKNVNHTKICKEKSFENVTKEEEAIHMTRRFEMEPNITSRETKYGNHNQKHHA